MPTVFVPTEIRESETRAAANPDSVARLIKLGMSVQIQAGAGAGSQISDQAFEAAGATIVPDAATGYGNAGRAMPCGRRPVDETTVSKQERCNRTGSVSMEFYLPWSSSSDKLPGRRRRVRAFESRAYRAGRSVWPADRKSTCRRRA